jgi:hypothetical protein
MRDIAPGSGVAKHTTRIELDRLVAALRGSAMNVGGLLLMLAVLAALFALLMPDTFLRVTTLQAIMFQLPELGLLSLAMAIPLIAGGINLAIVATANLASLLTAWILTAQMPPDAVDSTLEIWLAGALAAGLVLCVVVGVVSGLLVAVLEVHPILVTLGTMTLLHGLGIFYTRGRTISGFSAATCVCRCRLRRRQARRRTGAAWDLDDRDRAVVASDRRLSTSEAALGGRANASLAQPQPPLGQRFRGLHRKCRRLASHRQYQTPNPKAGETLKVSSTITSQTLRHLYATRLLYRPAIHT